MSLKMIRNVLIFFLLTTIITVFHVFFYENREIKWIQPHIFNTLLSIFVMYINGLAG